MNKKNKLLIVFNHKYIIHLLKNSSDSLKTQEDNTCGIRCNYNSDTINESCTAPITKDNILEFVISNVLKNSKLALNKNIIKYFASYFYPSYSSFKNIKLDTNIDMENLKKLLHIVELYLMKILTSDIEFSIYFKSIYELNSICSFKQFSYSKNSHLLKIYISIKDKRNDTSFGDYLYLRENLDYIIEHKHFIYEFIDNIYKNFKIKNNNKSEINDGTYNCILSNQVVSLLIHETIGHITEADVFFKNNKHKNLINHKIFDSKLSIMDLANRFSPILSPPLNFNIDSEGNACKDITLIKNGKLLNLLSNEDYSEKYHVTPCGNSRFDNIFNSPLIRMRNTYVAAGKSKFNDLIHNTSDGLYLSQASIGDTSFSGDFEINITSAFKIENGIFTKSLSDFKIIGNCFSLLENITAITSDIKWFIFDCTKYGQEVQLSCSCPKIQCNLRIAH